MLVELPLSEAELVVRIESPQSVSMLAKSEKEKPPPECRVGVHGPPEGKERAERGRSVAAADAVALPLPVLIEAESKRLPESEGVLETDEVD